MKNLLYIFLCCSSVAVAQNAMYNNGSIRIHDTGTLGLHTNLINNAPFQDNLGTLGFYGQVTTSVTGAFIPVFYDVEMYKPFSAAILETSITATNALNLVDGDFVTYRNNPLENLKLTQNAFTVGESNLSKVDGYMLVEQKQNFFFTVGDSGYIRPLTLQSQSENVTAKCAYFFEDPNLPSTFTTSFNTNNKEKEVRAVSTTEFWDIDSSLPSTVSISWNNRSNIANLVDEYYQVGIAGWHRTQRRWVNLGSVDPIGDLNQGAVTSETFVPNDYEVITLAKMAVATELLDLDNYYVSPNGDGINDNLVIPELEESPNNRLRIYDRNGLKVFEKDNYNGEFNGYSNTNNTIYQRNAGLPSGIYFYLVFLDDLQLEYQGFLYLTDTGN